MNPAINAVGSYICTHLDKLSLLYQAAETGSVVWQTSSAERFEQNAKVRSVFSGVSLFMACVSALALFQGQWGLVSKAIRIVPMLSIPAIIGICGVVLGVGFVIAAAVRKSENFTQPGNASVTSGVPSNIELFQASNAARLVVNLALAYFSANPYLYLAAAGLGALNLGAMRRWSWIKYTREFPTQLQNATKIKITYYLPLFPVQVCKDHPLSKQNAETLVHQKFQLAPSDFAASGLRYDNTKGQAESISYRMYLNAQNLPNCADAQCKNPLSGHADTEVSVYDTRFPEADRWKAAKVIITPRGVSHPRIGAFEAAAT